MMDEVLEDASAISDNLYNITYQGNSSTPGRFSDFQQVVNVCNTYLTPFIIITGILGNVISFTVFICSQLRRLSTSVYLAALAVSDTSFLICVGIGWLETVQIDIFYGNGFCQFVVWVTYVFSFTSVWYVVCFTTEMYLSIFHSDIGQRISKPRKARGVVGFLFCFACAFYMYSFWSAKTVSLGDKLYCVPFTESRNVLIGLTFSDTTMTLLLPFSLLIFMNVRILIVIMRVYSTQRDTDVKNSSSIDANTDSSQQGDSHRAKYASKVQRKTTKMLVTVAMVFLLFNLPSHAVRVQSLFRSLFQPGYATSEIEFLIQQIAQLLYYTNFAVNFVIYNACAKSFRRAILRLPEIIICCACSEEYEVVHVPRRQQNARVIRHYNHEKFQNSRLVEVHLSEMHLSQMQSFASEFICRSPPCLIQDTPYEAEDAPCAAQDIPCLKQDIPCMTQDTPCMTQDMLCITQHTPCMTQVTSRFAKDTSV